MLRRIVNWFQERRQWERDHVAAWSAFVEPDATGLTKWQHFARREIESTLRANGVDPSEWQQRTFATPASTAREKQERYLFLEVPERDVWVYVYLNQANIAAVGGTNEFMFEEWSSQTPAELASKVCNALEVRLQNRRAG